jgi:hypothetical protein
LLITCPSNQSFNCLKPIIFGVNSAMKKLFEERFFDRILHSMLVIKCLLVWKKSSGGRIFLNRFRTASIKVIDCSQKVSAVSLFVYICTSLFRVVPKMHNLELIASTTDQEQRSYMKFGDLFKESSGLFFIKNWLRYWERHGFCHCVLLSDERPISGICLEHLLRTHRSGRKQLQMKYVLTNLKPFWKSQKAGQRESWLFDIWAFDIPALRPSKLNSISKFALNDGHI